MINMIYLRNRCFASLVCAITITMLSACSASNGFSEDPPPSAQHIPVYPNAESMRETVDGNVHTTIFTTTDDRTNVLNSYKSILLPEGWVMYPIPSNATPTISNARNVEDAVFSWRSNDNSYGYRLFVRISSGVSGVVTVTTEMGLDPGR